MDFFRNLFKSKEEVLREKRSALLSQKSDLMVANELLREKRSALLSQKSDLMVANEQKLGVKKSGVPVLRARKKLVNTLASFERKRDELNAQWDAAYANFSWWNKLKYDEQLDLSELDTQICHLKKAVKDFDRKYQKPIAALNQHFGNLRSLSKQRIDQAYDKLVQAVEKGLVKDVNDTSLSAAWLAMLSVPVSIADDLDSANQVYGALKAVNGNFEGMSNSEIWWETLWMSPESHAGLVSLTKGAYFEQLVASDTGGLLHEHFNTPDTDMILNGVEFQLKATDSVDYLNSVNDDIAIIATSEVAGASNAIDSGYLNEELTSTVELALGGGVIDAADTTIDALLTGVGSLGVFATIKGINHASARYEQGVDGVEAIFEGAGVAIEGTAKGIVDASEMVYKVAMSRPSRFVGRTLLKGLKKLDEKLMEAPNGSDKER